MGRILDSAAISKQHDLGVHCWIVLAGVNGYIPSEHIAIAFAKFVSNSECRSAAAAAVQGQHEVRFNYVFVITYFTLVIHFVLSCFELVVHY